MSLSRSIAIACAALTGAAQPVAAAEWSLAPAFAWSADHDSNRNLSSVETPGESAAATLELELAQRAERGEFRLRPSLRIQRFSDQVSDDVNDTSVWLSWQREFERSRLTLSGGYADESTLTSDIVETGIVAADARRRLADANFSWEAQQSETLAFSASAAHSDVSYSGARAERLFDYRYTTLSLRETFAVTERTALFVTGIGSQLDSLEQESDSRERGANVGFTVALNERTTVSASAGRSWRSAEGVDSTGDAYDVSIVHRQELRDWSFGYSRSLVPYGTGVLGEREALSFALRQPLREQLAAVLDCALVRNHDAGLGATLDRRNYQRAEASLVWTARRSFVLRGALRYTEASLPDESGEAAGWNFGLSATFRPDPRILGH